MTETAADRPAAVSLFSPVLRATTIGLLIVVTLIAFEAMSVATALPTAARELHGLAGYGWAFTGFLIANIVALVASGLLCDRWGPRPSLTGGLALFVAGLIVAGSAVSMGQLVAGRIVQGLGSGLLLTAMYVLIGECYPNALRPKVMAAISSAWVLPSLIGPPVSGAVTQHLTWRLVFLGLVPLVLLGGLLMVPTLRTLPATRRKGRKDGVGRLVRAVAVAVGVAALVQAGQHPSALWLTVGAVGLAAVGWGLARLLPPGTVRLAPGVPVAVALRGLFAGALFGTDSLVPLVLSEQHGYGATEAGLPLLGAALTWSLGSWWQGRDAMADRGPLLVRTGFGLLAVACVGAAFASVPSWPGWLMYPAWLVAGLGAGLTMSSVGVHLLRWTNDTYRGRDSAALQLADGVVSAITTGIGGVLVAAAAHDYISYTHAFVSIDIAMVAIAVVGIFGAARMRGTPVR